MQKYKINRSAGNAHEQTEGRAREKERERGIKRDFITAVINDKQVQAGQVVLQGVGEL